MKKFCRDNPAERLGYQKDGIQDIKKNRWFQVHNISNTVTAGSRDTHSECRYRWFQVHNIYNAVTAGSRYTTYLIPLPLVPGTQHIYNTVTAGSRYTTYLIPLPLVPGTQHI
jgi:hypothetical protein